MQVVVMGEVTKALTPFFVTTGYTSRFRAANCLYLAIIIFRQSVSNHEAHSQFLRLIVSVTDKGSATRFKTFC